MASQPLLVGKHTGSAPAGDSGREGGHRVHFGDDGGGSDVSKRSDSSAPSGSGAHRGSGVGFKSRLSRASRDGDADGDGVRRQQSGIHRAFSSLRVRAAKKRDMTTREQLFLSPLEKYRRFGKFPMKLVLNLALVATTTAMVCISNAEDGAFFRANLRTWHHFFFPDDYDWETPYTYVFELDDAVQAVKDSVDNYYHINERSLDSFDYWQPGDGRTTDSPSSSDIVVPLEVTVFADPASLFNPNVTTSHATITTQYTLNETYFGPIDPDIPDPEKKQKALEGFFHKLVSMTLTFRLQNFGFGSLYRTCIQWEVPVTYDFQHRGEIRMFLQQKVANVCDDRATWAEAVSRNRVWLNFVVLFLAAWYEVLSVRAVFARIRLFFRIRTWAIKRAREEAAEELLRSDKHDGDDGGPSSGAPQSYGSSAAAVFLGSQKGMDTEAPVSSWDDLSFSDKLRLVNWWFAIATAANACLIIACTMNLVLTASHDATSELHNLILGVGIFLMYLSLLRYLGHNRNYYALVLTLRRSVPRVGRFLVGVTPVFMAYALFATVVFSDLPRFGDLQQSVVTLFAVLNGDVIRETFMALIPENPVVGQLFLYSFICLFIYVVLNVLIAILEEAFFYTAQRSMELLQEKENIARTLRREGVLDGVENDPVLPPPSSRASRPSHSGLEMPDVELVDDTDATAESLAAARQRRRKERRENVSAVLDSHLLNAQDRFAQLLRYKDLDELEEHMTDRK